MLSIHFKQACMREKEWVSEKERGYVKIGGL